MAPKTHHKSSSSSLSGHPHDSHVSQVTQVNYSDLVGLDANFLRRPQRQGSLWNVSYGRNYTGKDVGNVCVAKWVRSDHRCGAGKHTHHVARVCDAAAEAIYQFQRALDTRGYSVEVVKPTVLRGGGAGHARTILVEPYVHGLRRYNSYSGRAGESTRTHEKVVQALSHFSYVWSRGQWVLCDLQGAVQGDGGKTIVLTPPRIMSMTRGTFGCRDLGREYVQRFFERHECSGICKHLPTPKNNKMFFRPAPGA